MTQISGKLIDDSLEQVKASLLYIIKKVLTEAYPKEFGDYSTSRGDLYTKVYWADTVRYQPNFPYCMLTPQRDALQGLDEITYLRREDGEYVKRTKTRSTLTVSIDVCDMGNEETKKSSLKADNFAHKVTRQLRKYFNGDEMLDWFSGNEYYPNQIGIGIDTNISNIITWDDTDTVFRYTFDISLSWIDIVDDISEPAKGVRVETYENKKLIDEFEISL